MLENSGVAWTIQRFNTVANIGCLVQQLIHVNNKETSNPRITGPLFGETIGHQLNFLSVMRKSVLCHDVILYFTEHSN